MSGSVGGDDHVHDSAARVGTIYEEFPKSGFGSPSGYSSDPGAAATRNQAGRPQATARSDGEGEGDAAGEGSHLLGGPPRAGYFGGRVAAPPPGSRETGEAPYSPPQVAFRRGSKPASNKPSIANRIASHPAGRITIAALAPFALAAASAGLAYASDAVFDTDGVNLLDANAQEYLNQFLALVVNNAVNPVAESWFDTKVDAPTVEGMIPNQTARMFTYAGTVGATSGLVESAGEALFAAACGIVRCARR